MASEYDWLRYNNAGATRNKPLDPELLAVLAEVVPDLGLTMDVISGGQDAIGEGTRRTGSTRHDHGLSADADFYRDGAKLDWNNEADLEAIGQLVGGLRGAGVTGIGAGDDYMGPGRLHVGFGPEAVWGAGGKSENAPSWLKQYFYGAEPGSVRRGEDAHEGNADDSETAGLMDRWRRNREERRSGDDEEYDGHFNKFAGETLGLNDFRSNMLDKIGLSDDMAGGIGRVLVGLGGII